jgi:carboxypeptidase Taq
MHESGHAMYNQGIDRRLDRTPLWAGASPGVHESQSRLWENLVGRSRGFWRWAFPQLQAIFPDSLGDVDAEGFYRAVNKVQPSFIRVEADELTYNLHILLRFELENELLESKLAVADVPEAWRAKMRTYVGVEPPDDGRGALQDVHWTGVSFGGFPSYTLGNVIGAQLMKAARAELSDLDSQVERGDFSELLSWLRENVYRHGRKFTPGELLERATGEGLSAAPWIEYARGKFSELYGLAD